MDGMIRQSDGSSKPGEILALWAELRKAVGTVEAKKKEGVKFKVRSAEDLIDKVRGKANELGILIYPHTVSGKGHVVEDGTLAELNMVVAAQAVSDGSILTFEGFGLGADNQDKAGGKAGTYAFKAALIQALLAGGSKEAKALGVVDTDDSDSPIAGGVRAKGKSGPKVEEVVLAFTTAGDGNGYKVAVGLLKQLSSDKQVAFDKQVIKDAQARLGITPGSAAK
jgi:ERF superfamily